MNKHQIKTELEKTILSCMLNEPESIPFIYQRIKPEDFTEDNRQLFEALIQLDVSKVNDGDMLILNLSSQKIGNWNINELYELKAKNASLNSLIYNSVLERFGDVTLFLKAEGILKAKLNEAKESVNGLDFITDLIDTFNNELSRVQNFKEDKSYNVRAIISEIEDELSSKKITSYTTANIPSFNNATGGIMPSNLIGIAGSYKSGKTTFGLNLIMDFVKQNIPCGFFSLELSEKELNRKILAMLSNVPYEKLREPKKLTDIEKQTLSKLYENYKKNFPLYITDKRMTEIEIKNKSKYWRDRYGVKIILIDYIGYIKSKKKFETRERELSHYSEFLKGLAKELDIPVIALAQLNRQGKQSPGTENLAESIALARDCDFLFTIFNPLEIGIKSANGITFNENNFIVKLDTSRHTKNKSSFVLELSDSGNLREMVSEYDNRYLNNKSSSILPPELAKYVKREEIEEDVF